MDLLRVENRNSGATRGLKRHPELSSIHNPFVMNFN